MLKRSFRLPATTLLHRPTTFQTADFLIKVSENNLVYRRFGFVVGKKVAKRAVVRNRIRRVFRSCIEEMIEEIVPGKDMLFFLKKSIMDKHRDELLGDLRRVLIGKNLII